MKLDRKMRFLLYIQVFLCFCSYSSINAVDYRGEENLGVIVISHGAPMPIWNQKVLELIRSVKSPYQLEAAFLDFDEEWTLEKSVKRLEEKGVNEILVVHLSPSSYSNHHEEIKYRVGLRKDLGIYTKGVDMPVKSKVKRFVVSPSMDDHPLVVDILTDYAKELSENPERESLILTGHGPVEELENMVWLKQYKSIAKEIRKVLKFRRIVCMNLRYDSADVIREQAFENLRKTAKRLSNRGKVIVLCYVLGPKKIQDEAKLILEGVPSVVVSTKGVCSHPKAVKWIEDTISKGMNQPTFTPINRDWTLMDIDTGKPVGTSRYGFY